MLVNQPLGGQGTEKHGGTLRNSQPNAEEKRWRESVREQGCVLTGSPAVIHHCVGRTARHNKVDIGHWWVIPLDPREHSFIHAMGSHRKLYEKALFRLVIASAMRLETPLPSPDVLDAIFDYHR